MDIASFIVVFVCAWWLCLFTVLPLWIQRDESGNPIETSPGAPKQSFIKRKFIVATIMAVICTGLIYVLVTSDLLSFREISQQMAEEDFG